MVGRDTVTNTCYDKGRFREPSFGSIGIVRFHQSAGPIAACTAPLARRLDLGGQAGITLHERKATLRTTNMRKRQIGERMSWASEARRERPFGVKLGSRGASSTRPL
jgi:hypothetical protein